MAPGLLLCIKYSKENRYFKRHFNLTVEPHGFGCGCIIILRGFFIGGFSPNRVSDHRWGKSKMHMADALISPAVGGTMWAASAGLIGYCSKKIWDFWPGGRRYSSSCGFTIFPPWWAHTGNSPRRSTSWKKWPEKTPANAEVYHARITWASIGPVGVDHWKLTVRMALHPHF